MYDELISALRNNADHYAFTGDNGLVHLLTNAADAIEELSKRVDESIPKDDAEIIIAEVAKPRWIPVSERLPGHDKNVLICYEWTGRSRTAYREVGIASIEELERDPTEMFRPIAWMPLPKPYEPPKEE